MKFEEVFKMWEDDAEISITDLSGEAARTPKLHHKYYMVYVQESLKKRKLESERQELIRDKSEYYRDEMDIEDVKARGWKPLQKKIMKAEVKQYVDTDKDVVDLTLKIATLDEKVMFLESIIKQINSRNFLIKSIIDFEKFKVGAN